MDNALQKSHLQAHLLQIILVYHTSVKLVWSKVLPSFKILWKIVDLSNLGFRTLSSGLFIQYLCCKSRIKYKSYNVWDKNHNRRHLKPVLVPFVNTLIIMFCWMVMLIQVHLSASHPLTFRWNPIGCCICIFHLILEFVNHRDIILLHELVKICWSHLYYCVSIVPYQEMLQQKPFCQLVQKNLAFLGKLMAVRWFYFRCWHIMSKLSLAKIGCKMKRCWQAMQCGLVFVLV